MPGIDKAGFLKRLEKKATEYESPMPGEPSPKAPPEEGGGEMTCGEQLMAAVNAGDGAGVDAALREAVAKYGG